LLPAGRRRSPSAAVCSAADPDVPHATETAETEAAVTVKSVAELNVPSAAVIVDEPAIRPVARPDALIVATAVLDEVHTTWPVTSAVDPSVKVPVAVNCWVVPSAIVGLAGVTAIDVTTTGVTVSVVVPPMSPSVAVIVETPVASVDARTVALTVATVVFADAQLTEFVSVLVEPSENVPVAANCSVRPLATLGSVGVTEIDRSVALTTVTELAPATAPSVAVIVDEPVATVDIKPVAEMVATDAFNEVQVTELVRLAIVPSVNVPVAVTCCWNPSGTFGSAGVAIIDMRAAGATVSVVTPVTAPSLALMVVPPEVCAVARPFASIDAIAVFDEVHVTDCVRFSVEPSVSVPIAVNCCVRPWAKVGSAGVTVMDATTAGVTVSVVLPLMPPSVAVMVDMPVARVEAKPELEIVAIVIFTYIQITEFVRFSVEPSLKVPVATNCWLRPLATLGSLGVSAIDVTIAGVTVSVVSPLMAPSVAVIDS
jgi:hypothetical protein